jgi:hypothetical protein
MALASGHTILAPLGRALAAAHEVQLAEDLTQLQGLCERMDSEGFLPLTGDERTTASPRRLLQYMPLINDLVTRAVNSAGCDNKGLTTTQTPRGYGRYFRFTSKNVQLCVAVDFRKWQSLGSTPLWLWLWPPIGTLPMVRDVLGPLEHDTPALLFVDPDEPRQLCVPLFAPLGEEREAVLESLFKQLLEPLRLLALLPAIQSGVPVVATATTEELAGGLADERDILAA